MALVKLIFASLLLLSCSALADNYPAYPTPALPSDAAKSAEIQRGEYLVKLGDCVACHTAPNGGKALAGGFSIKTPFGTIYTPNLTPDKKTGIGNWTDAQFIKAMREGISPEGKYYYPAFPYLYFNKINTADLLAIKAYLDAIPAVNNTPPKNTMMFPFNWRFLQLGWRILFFHPDKTGAFQTDHGAYLVEGLGHCAMCHTPSYYLFSKNLPLAAPIQKYNLTGGMVENFFAPNISSSGLKNASVQDISAVFKQNKMIGGGAVQGPMLDANENSLKYLSDDDVVAIAAYLKSVKSIEPPKPKTGKGLSAGKAIFNQYCTGCHMTGAGGAPKIGDQTAWAPLIKQGMPALYQNAIKGINGMPAKGACSSCSDQDIQNAVQYMVSETQGENGIAAPKKVGDAPKQYTMADGKALYTQYCSACHDGHYPGAPVVGDKAAWAPILQQGMDVMILNTVNGINNMPPRGSCKQCDDAQLIAAVKYMADTSKSDNKDYSLW